MTDLSVRLITIDVPDAVIETIDTKLKLNRVGYAPSQTFARPVQVRAERVRLADC